MQRLKNKQVASDGFTEYYFEVGDGSPPIRVTDFRDKFNLPRWKSHFENKSESEKLNREAGRDTLSAVWHSPEVVFQAWYAKHKQGKTIESMLADIKLSEERERKAINRQTENIKKFDNLQKQSEENRNIFGEQYRELGRSIDKIDYEVSEALKIIGERPASLVFYNKNGIRITEDDMKKIFVEYFRGTNLEDISYNWREILNPEYLGDIVEIWKLAEKGSGEPDEIVQLLLSISGKLGKSFGSIKETNKKKLQRAIKENDIRVWILSTGVNKLKRDVISDPKRVAINYKIDKGETTPILTELSHRINRHFRTRFTPIDLIPWVAVGMVALICFGLWFVSRRRKIRR